MWLSRSNQNFASREASSISTENLRKCQEDHTRKWSSVLLNYLQRHNLVLSTVIAPLNCYHEQFQGSDSQIIRKGLTHLTVWTLSSSVSSVSEVAGVPGSETLDPKEELLDDPGLLLRISLTLSLEDEVITG